jgi:hypothetical protein
MEGSLFIVAIQAPNGANQHGFKRYAVLYSQVLRKVPPPPKCPSKFCVHP